MHKIPHAARAAFAQPIYFRSRTPDLGFFFILCALRTSILSNPDGMGLTSWSKFHQNKYLNNGLGEQIKRKGPVLSGPLSHETEQEKLVQKTNI
jgi:hypothetical protein